MCTRSKVFFVALFALAFAMLVGCKRSSSEAGFTSLGASTSAVRDAFNRDVGSVRVVMLVSPT